MADDRKQGWQPWEPAEDRGDSGVGAFSGSEHPVGPGDHGIGEGRKPEGAPPIGSGPPQPEFPPEGWGGEGENYPPAEGPLGTDEEAD
jgi:hypothetical protein